MKFTPHQHGRFTVKDGSIISVYQSSYMPNIVDNPAIIIDIETGCLHKAGDASWVKDVYDKMVQKISNKLGTEYAKDYVYIEFNPKTGDSTWDSYNNAQLTKDEICTIVNYFGNCIGEEKMQEILNMDITTLHQKLSELASIGF
jgi:hypothetical protein